MNVTKHSQWLSINVPINYLFIVNFTAGGIIASVAVISGINYNRGCYEITIPVSEWVEYLTDEV